MVVRVMVKNLVPPFANIHVTDDPVDAAKCVVRRQMEMIPPPLERLRATVAATEAVPVR